MVPGGTSLTQHMAGYPVFAPHSIYARSIAALSHGVLLTTLAILLLVIGLVTYATRKFREKPDTPPRLIYGNTKLEVGYTSDSSSSWPSSRSSPSERWKSRILRRTKRTTC